jgi:Rad3-related DNA helicase
VRKIEALTKELEALGTKSAPTKQRFVQIARQPTPTMPEYIQRCNNLEAVISDYESNLRDGDRLLGQALEELQQLKADKGYAAMIPLFTVLQNVLHKDLESAQAFRKEVDYAKQLAALATPDDQTRFYKANILPIKNDEKRIAKEEIEILKDAKARGVNLPESMYREAGIQ